VGHVPYRPLPFTTLDALIKEWDRHKIDKGVVQSLNAVWYRNAHNGNRELYREAKSHRKRVTLFGTIHPAYVAWEDDLKQCVEEYGVEGINLHPHYHGYGLGFPKLKASLERIARLRLPVALTIRFEDPRQRHPLDAVPELAAWEIARLVAGFPDIRWMIHNATDAVPMLAEIRGRNPAAENFVFTNAFLWGPPESHDRRLIGEAGKEHFALGTHLPFRYAASALLKFNAA
jgi:hypothetical protein